MQGSRKVAAKKLRTNRLPTRVVLQIGASKDFGDITGSMIVRKNGGVRLLTVK